MSRVSDNSSVDLRALELAQGASQSLTARVAVPTLIVSEMEYKVLPPELEVTVVVTRSLSGWHVRVKTSAELVGPCWRCLEDARLKLTVDTEEFAAYGREGSDTFDEDLDSEYITGEKLDLESLVRDALVERIPLQIVCRPDCAGLCPSCGANLNDAECDCAPPPTDTRWDSLLNIFPDHTPGSGEDDEK